MDWIRFSKSLCLGFSTYIPSCDTSRTQTFFWVVGVFLVVLIGFARFALIELLSFFRCLSLVLLSFSHLLKNPLVRLGFLSPSVIERESIHGYDDIGLSQMDYTLLLENQSSLFHLFAP